MLQVISYKRDTSINKSNKLSLGIEQLKAHKTIKAVKHNSSRRESREKREQRIFKDNQAKRLKADRKRVEELSQKDPRSKTPGQIMREYNMVPKPELEVRPVNQRLRTVVVKKAVTFEEDNLNVVTIEDYDLVERSMPEYSIFQ